MIRFEDDYDPAQYDDYDPELECFSCGKYVDDSFPVECLNGDTIHFCGYACAEDAGEVCPLCTYLINEECECPEIDKSALAKLSTKDRMHELAEIRNKYILDHGPIPWESGE